MSLSSSPPPATPPRHNTRTYGRRKETCSLNASTSSSGPDSIGLDEPTPWGATCAPPSSEPADTSMELHNDSDDGGQHATGSYGQFYAWKKRLDDIDRTGDSDDEEDANIARNQAKDTSEERKNQLSGPLSQTTTQPNSPKNPFDASIFGGGLSLTTLDSSSQSQHIDEDPPFIPSLPSRKRVLTRVVSSDDEDAHLNQSIDTTSSQIPYPIATPASTRSRSASLPTTPDDQFSPIMKSSKSKRKAPRNVPPLQLTELQDESRPSSSSKKYRSRSDSDKGKGKQRSKIKEPTKKELAETNRERARLAAEQNVSIPRDNKPRYITDLLSRFTSGLSKEQLQSKKPLCSQSSDPIEAFSSPAVDTAAGGPRGTKRIQPESSIIISTSSPTRDSKASPKRPPFRELKALPIRALPTTTIARNRTLSTSTAPPAKNIVSLSSDEDEDLPSLEEITRREKQRQHLAEFKKKAAAEAERKKATRVHDIPSESDDDLLVEDASMQVVAKEEADQRRARKMRNEKVSEGRKRQMMLAGVRDRNKAGVKTSSSPVKKTSPKLKKDDLMISLRGRIELENRVIDAEKSEEWVRRGGVVKKDPSGEAAPDFDDVKKLYEEIGAKALRGANQKANVEAEADDEEDSDEDWEPEGSEHGSASPSSTRDVEDDGDQDFQDDEEPTMLDGHTSEADDEGGSDLDGKENVKPMKSRKNQHNVIDSDMEEDENAPPVGQRVLAPNSSFTQTELPASLRLLPISPDPFPRAQTAFSTDGRTDDESDNKENNTSLMYDKGDDKENKAVARHLANTEMSSQSLTMSPAAGIDKAREDDLPLARRRKPFLELPRDDDDPFASPSFRDTSTPSFVERLQNSSPERTLVHSASQMPMPLSLAPKFGSARKDQGLSQFMDSDEDTFGDENVSERKGPILQPSFLDEFESMTQPKAMDPFSDDENANGLSKLRKSGEILQLTQLPPSLDPGIRFRPALQLSASKRRQADTIFEKEQEYLLELAVQKPKEKVELYINEDGLLTQTRPSEDAEVYIPPPTAESTYGTNLSTTSQQSSARRDPLQTLSFSSSGLSPDESPISRRPLGRLHRGKDSSGFSSRSTSPSPTKPSTAFDAMFQASRHHAKKQKQKLGKSVFVEAEAQESDEDEAYGFGKKVDDEDDEDEDEDMDKPVEGLVDDAEMDEQTKARELVLEKVREHQEEDDARDEKIARDAIEGKLGKKRRQGNVGFDDSDDEDDEDENGARIRRKMAKKRRVGDDLDKLAQHEKTKPFVESYNKTFQDDDDQDFAHLQQSADDLMPAEDSKADEDEEQHEVDGEALRAEIRQAARQGQLHDNIIDPHDVSWVNGDMDSDEEMRVRVKPIQPTGKRSGPSRAQADFDDFQEATSVSTREGDRERVQNLTWAKSNQTRNAGTGRGSLASAVTGHAKKAKTGGGSLRLNSKAKPAQPTSESASRKPAKSASILSGLMQRTIE